MMRCDICGKEFEAENRSDGLPNGMSFMLEDGGQITMCADCIIEEGRRKKEECIKDCNS